MKVIAWSEYDNGRNKRQRRSGRPCDACRRKKTRCVVKDAADVCVLCEMRSITCTFEADPPVRAGGSTTLRQSQDGPPTPASSRNITTGEQPLIDSAGGRQPSQGAVQSPVHGPTSDLQPEPTYNTSVRSSPLVMSETPQVLGLAHSRFSELYGLGSDMEPVLMRHRPYERTTQEFRLGTHAIRRVLSRDAGVVNYPLTFHMASDERAIDSNLTALQTDSIEDCVHPHGERLVELFWRQVQPSYPILSKGRFMSDYSTSYRSVCPALLGAIYLSATRWWSYDIELSIHPIPDISLLRKRVKQALDSSYHRPKLSSIQAALLLLQCLPEDALNPDHTYAWGLTCQALAIGQCLALHLDASEWTIPQWERNVRKRLSWALYIQDRWTALAYGRPVHIHNDDWVVTDLTETDFTDCRIPGSDEERMSLNVKGELQFRLLADLTTILSTVLSTYYTARTSLDQNTVLLYLRAQPVIAQLQAWYQRVPPSLSTGIIYQRKLNFHGSLHLSYYGVMIALLRRLIRSTALPPRCSDDMTLSAIRQLGLHTAQAAANLVLSLRPDQLESFWYFTSPYLLAVIGSFTTLLLVTSLSTQERAFWQDNLKSYLWNLRMMSKSSEGMRYAVNRLEGAILRGLEHALAVNPNEPIDEAVSPAVFNSTVETLEFADFGDWDIAAGVDGAFDFLSGMDFDSIGVFDDSGIN